MFLPLNSSSNQTKLTFNSVFIFFVLLFILPNEALPSLAVPLSATWVRSDLLMAPGIFGHGVTDCWTGWAIGLIQHGLLLCSYDFWALFTEPDLFHFGVSSHLVFPLNVVQPRRCLCKQRGCITKSFAASEAAKKSASEIVKPALVVWFLLAYVLHMLLDVLGNSHKL
ncbi:UNVERIFIED_CONTAM: hypothetical protein K2H54_040024 [Gekko kuhli]